MSANFFAEIFRPEERKRQQMHQVVQCIYPKRPDRPKKCGTRAEEQHRATDGAQHHEAPQLSLGPEQEKSEHRASDDQAVQSVQKARQPGEPQPKGAQQVIQQPGGQPQQDGLTEYQQLLGDLNPHGQPKRRLKNPPRLWPWSS